MKKIILLFMLVCLYTKAQNYIKLHDFDSVNGKYPTGQLISDGMYLYGMTTGNANDYGTIFKIKPDGSNFYLIHNFSDDANGKYPYSSLMYDGTYLYGTTSRGGINNKGTIFKIKADGIGFTKLHDFNNAILPGISAQPCYGGHLISDGTYLYGITFNGGSDDNGTVFKIKFDGTDFTTLFDFFDINSINGCQPHGALIYDGTFLYGVATRGGTGYGGSSYGGVIFKIKPDGAEFTKLHDFSGVTEGDQPLGGLVSNGTYLYGVTLSGGVNHRGTVFKLRPDGTEFTSIYKFSGGAYGEVPFGSVIVEEEYLYGTTKGNGGNTKAVVFKLKSDGTNYTVLNTFNGTNGKNPLGSLYTDGYFLYGTTAYGGTTENYGVIYKFGGFCIRYPTLEITSEVTNVCANVAVTFSASGANTYTWSTGEIGTSATLFPSLDSVYFVAGTNNFGCVSTNTLQMTVFPCTSIEENRNLKSEIKIYPNPANTEIYFDISDEKEFDVKIYNTLGQIVLSENNYTNRSAINIGALNKDLYFYKVKTNKGNYFGKIVVN